MSKWSERWNHRSKCQNGVKGGITDLNVKMEFRKNVAAEVQSSALVISNRLLKFQSNGSKVNVVVWKERNDVKHLFQWIPT